MGQRYRGVVPTTFMTVPGLGEVEPGTVLFGAAAEAVAGRSDFEPVDETPVADAEAVAGSEPAAGEAAPAKPRKSAPKADAAA